jgi:dual specificity phosphatase 12
MGQDTENEIKRIIVVGLNRSRLSKVMSLVAECEEPTDYSPHFAIVEYIPCLAEMSSYEDEKGRQVRYMSKFVFHDGSAMTRFFDDEEFRSSLALVVMVGYEWMESDQEYIANYFQTNNLPVNVECIQPNSNFSSLRSEMDFLKNLNEEEKTEHILNQTLGLGKMARFVLDRSRSLKGSKEEVPNVAEAPTNEAEDFIPEQNETEKSATDEINAEKQNPQQEQERRQVRIDPELPRFACRICRTILLGTNHLAEDHIQNLHSFKISHGTARGNNKVPCQSVFCDESVLEWLSLEGKNDVEGRLTCPKCSTKLGHWNWSGAQCSCGTWVVPAIQIPMSNIDTVIPTQHLHFPVVTPQTSIK